MSASDPEEIANTAAGYIDSEGGLAPFLERYGVGGISFAVILAFIDGIGAAGDLLLAPWRALADGLAELVDGTLGVGIDIIVAGGETSTESFTDGLTAILGPFAFPAAVGITLLAVYVFIQGVVRIEFSPRVFISNLRP